MDHYENSGNIGTMDHVLQVAQAHVDNPSALLQVLAELRGKFETMSPKDFPQSMAIVEATAAIDGVVEIVHTRLDKDLAAQNYEMN